MLYNESMIKAKSGLWQEFSRKIRKSCANHEGYVVCPSCLRSFPWQETDCGHFIENTERKKDWGGNALWYDSRNFSAQCRSCNTFKSAEAKREWTARFIDEHGIEYYEELKTLHRTPKKWTPEMVNEILEQI